MVAQSLPAEQLYTRQQHLYKPLSFDKPELGVSEVERDGERYVVFSRESPLLQVAKRYKEALDAVEESLLDRADEFSLDIVEPDIKDIRTFRLNALDDTHIHPFIKIGSNLVDLDFVNTDTPDRFVESIIPVAESLKMSAEDLYNAISPFFAYYDQDGYTYIMYLKFPEDLSL